MIKSRIGQSGEPVAEQTQSVAEQTIISPDRESESLLNMLLTRNDVLGIDDQPPSDQ